MNTSNPFGTETIARQRQAEIGKHLRQEAQLRGLRAPRTSSGLKRRLAVGLASLSIIGLTALAIASQLP